MTKAERIRIRAEFEELKEEHHKNDVWKIETMIRVKKTHSTIESSIDVSNAALCKEWNILDLVDFCNTGKYPL